MEAIELVMKIWGIEEASRAELEGILARGNEKTLGLSLACLGACADDTFSEQNDRWMATYLPEVQLR